MDQFARVFFLQNDLNSLEYIIYPNKKVKIKLVRILKSHVIDLLLYSILNEVCFYENASFNTVLLYLKVGPIMQRELSDLKMFLKNKRRKHVSIYMTLLNLRSHHIEHWTNSSAGSTMDHINKMGESQVLIQHG